MINPTSIGGLGFRGKGVSLHNHPQAEGQFSEPGTASVPGDPWASHRCSGTGEGDEPLHLQSICTIAPLTF